MRKDWYQNKQKANKAKMKELTEKKELTDIKAFNYYTSLQILYTWLPIITLALLAISYNIITKVILFPLLGGLLYRLISKHFKISEIKVTFTPESIIYKNKIINLVDIQDYCLCTNVEKYFLFRIKTKGIKKHVLHIHMDYKSEIESYLINHRLPKTHRLSDSLIRMAAMFYLIPLMLLFVLAGKFFGLTS